METLLNIAKNKKLIFCLSLIGLVGPLAGDLISIFTGKITLLSFATLILGITPYIILMLCAAKDNGKADVRILLALSFALFSLVAIVGIVNTIMFGIFTSAIFNFAELILFGLAAFEFFKNTPKKLFGIIANLFAVLIALYSAFSNINTYKLYIEFNLESAWIWFVFAITEILGIGIYLAGALICLAKSNFGIYNKKDLNDTKSATPEQQLSLLKSKYDNGEISKEEFEMKRQEIIKNL